MACAIFSVIFSIKHKYFYLFILKINNYNTDFENPVHTN